MPLRTPRFILRAAVSLLLLCIGAFAAEASEIWLDVPFVKQEKDGCGAASIAMVMQYWQRQLGQPENRKSESASILHALYSKAAHGIRASDMVRYFQRNGYRTFEYAGDWADLAQQLGKGRPLIAALKAGSGGSLHYLVVVGVDPDRRLVLMNDPAQRKLLKEERPRFEREWKGAGNWTLLAVPDARPH
jgi:ABC-type bacteriocin/lantibiotic exporter with double-glycine peptidase domain